LSFQKNAKFREQVIHIPWRYLEDVILALIDANYNVAKKAVAEAHVTNLEPIERPLDKALLNLKYYEQIRELSHFESIRAAREKNIEKLQLESER
jgi:hypothetical protein